MPVEPKLLQEINLSEEARIAAAYASYAIVSKYAFDPSVITEGIGLQPLRCWSKGDQYIINKVVDPETKERAEVMHTRPLSLWRISSRHHLDSKYTEEHLLFLIGQLEPRKDWISQYLLNDENYAVSFQVWIESGVDTSGFALSSALLSRASQLSKQIYFSILCPLSYNDD
jgi:hypothetical protein